MIGSRCLVCKLLLLLLARACWSADAGYLAWYRSPIDDTDQAYGVYLPASPAPPGGFPAIFHAHGYGWSASDQFSDFQRRWADENGWVLININARGPTFYEGIGQEAVYEVVADACRRFGLNRARLFFTGGSMGGTGAFRVGIRNPEVFAAVASVDGWADWRLWHHHWYAREDQRDDIEEFRRPLLNSAAPLYWAERAMWGRVRAIVDGKDTVVWPDNSLRLAARLSELADGDPAIYRADTVINYDRGHGGGYDLRAIYAFFQGAPPAQLGRRVRLACWRLAYAQQGWLAITQIRRFGEQALAESLVADERISVWTKNVARLEVLPAESTDLGPCETCRVYVDGWLVYEGPPRSVSAAAIYGPAEQVVGWRLAEPRDLSQEPPAPAAPEKRPGLEGPIGDVLVRPFLVAYATEGRSEDVRRHREEAEAFARGWTGFFVHGPGIVALPEDRLPSRALGERNLVLFGCLDCSRLLRAAHRAYPLPVEVHHADVALREPSGREHRYVGPHFGAFFAYPNPLAHFGRYLLVCSGRWYTKPERQVPAGLEYDMEKLPWGYPDYVVFNNDQAQLPFVLNVNDKPPVTCYEPAYFVEAGYFDNQWRLDRPRVADWVKTLKPERARLIHVAELSRGPEVGVRVVYSDGKPVKAARVTVGDGSRAASALTGDDGWARFAPFPDPARVEVLNVMATGCAYDEAADCTAALPRDVRVGDLVVVRFAGPDRVGLGTPQARLQWEITNALSRPLEVRAQARVGRGSIHPAEEQALALEPGAKRTVTWQWEDGGGLAGPVQVGLRVRAAAGALDATGDFTRAVEVCEPGPAPVALAEPEVAQQGGSWQVKVKVANASDEALDAQLRAFVIQAAWACEDKTVRLEPGRDTEVCWTIPPEAGRWHQGLADVLVYAPGTSAWAKKDIALAHPGGESRAALR